MTVKDRNHLEDQVHMKDSIKMHVKEIIWEGVGQDSVVV